MSWVEGIHPIEGGHLVRPSSVVPALSSDEEGTLWIGAGAVVQGGIRHRGAIVLGKDASTWRGLDGGHEIVAGAGCVVKGPIEAAGTVTIQDRAVVHGDIHAAGDVRLLGQCIVGDVKAGGDILIVGSPTTGRLEPSGRVLTRPW